MSKTGNGTLHWNQRQHYWINIDIGITIRKCVRNEAVMYGYEDTLCTLHRKG